MNKIFKYFFALGIIIMSANVSASAQSPQGKCSIPDEIHIGVKPRFSVRPHSLSANVRYDAVSTMLTVSFPSNSQGGTVEVYRNGAKVTGATSNGGTTFSCILREYGEGNFTVIVYNGNTVIDNKNFTVR